MIFRGTEDPEEVPQTEAARGYPCENSTMGVYAGSLADGDKKQRKTSPRYRSFLALFSVRAALTLKQR